MSLWDSKMSANKLWLICTALLMISGCAMQQMGSGSQSATPLPNPTSSSSSSSSSSSGGLSFPSSQPQSSSSSSSSSQSSGSMSSSGGVSSQSSQSQVQMVVRGRVIPIVSNQLVPTTSNLGLDLNKANRAQHQVWHLQVHLKLVLRKQERRAQIWVQCLQVNLHPVSLMNLWGCLTKRLQVKESSLHLPEKALEG